MTIPRTNAKTYIRDLPLQAPLARLLRAALDDSREVVGRQYEIRPAAGARSRRRIAVR
jgi:hypothetical protein